MAKSTSQARAAILKAIKKIGGIRKVSAACDISEAAIKLWIKTGDLNDTKAVNAFRFARAADEPIEAFIVVKDD